MECGGRDDVPGCRRRRGRSRNLAEQGEQCRRVVMELCGLPREMFTPTFCAERVIGWSANILEQVEDSKIIRLAARYVGTPAPQPVPAP